ncbi:MAG: electron transfer flavoprotein subunit beta/FixA family protein [Sarcina sp.]
MKILVCVKEVIKDIKSISSKGIVERETIKLLMNKNDLYALEQALEMKDKYNATVTVLTMGEDVKKAAVTEALAMGADEGIILTDDNLKGSDTIATARALSDTIKTLDDFDLILFGEFSSESKAAVVGAMVSEKINKNLIENVLEIVAIDGEKIVLSKSMDNNILEIESKLPLVLTVRETKRIPRFPNYLDHLRAEKQEIKELSIKDIKGNEKNYGKEGSDIIISSVEHYEAKNENYSEENKNKIYEGSILKLTEALENKLKSLEILA